MSSLSSLSHVKRGKSGKRVSAPPLVSWCSFTGDRSGSMGSYGLHGAAEPLYLWYTEQAKAAHEENRKVYISVTTFDDEMEKRLENVDAKTGEANLSAQQARDWMRPRGCTKLYDTAIASLAAVRRYAREYVEALPKEVRALNPRVVKVWALMTDGYNNAGQMTKEDFKRAVELARKDGVECFFLAANCDGVSRGVEYGFDAQHSLTVADTPNEMRSAMCATSSLMRATSSGETNVRFSQAMRQSSAPIPHTTDRGGAGQKQGGLPTLRRAPRRPNRILRA